MVSKIVFPEGEKFAICSLKLKLNVALTGKSARFSFLLHAQPKHEY